MPTTEPLKERNDALVQARAAGTSINRLALRFGIMPHRFRHILERERLRVLEEAERAESSNGDGAA